MSLFSSGTSAAICVCGWWHSIGHDFGNSTIFTLASTTSLRWFIHWSFLRVRQVIKETSVVTLLRSGKKSVANSHICRLGKYKSENRLSENVNPFFCWRRELSLPISQEHLNSWGWRRKCFEMSGFSWRWDLLNYHCWSHHCKVAELVQDENMLVLISDETKWDIFHPIPVLPPST